MARKGSQAVARKRIRPAPRWRKCLLLGVLLVAVLGPTSAVAQLLAAPSPPDSAVASTASPTANVAGASSGAGASSSVRTLYVYGDQLRPLVEVTNGVQTLNIYGPGGQIIAQVVRDGQGGQEVRYLLADHLGSTRAVLDGDGNVVARFEYGPHGETTTAGTAAAEVRYRYTGHPYDEAQGVYETPARGYDPTLGRFLSVDAARQSTSPYSYTSNDPINKVDPDGQGEVYFYLYSEAGLGSGGQRTRARDMLGIKLASYASSPHDIVVRELESTRTTSLPSSLNIQHLTIDLHGKPTSVDVLDPKTRTLVSKSGEEFAGFLYDRLMATVEGPSKDFKSILLAGCELACRPGPSLGASNESEIPFGDRFASAAKKLFPQLEHVIASPYGFSAEVDPRHPNTVIVDVFRSGDLDHPDGLRIHVEAANFFTGNLPQKMYERPSSQSVEGILSWKPNQDGASATGEYMLNRNTEDIKNFISNEHGFAEPIFRTIPAVLPVEPPE